jgi:hypothetical protein
LPVSLIVLSSVESACPSDASNRVESPHAASLWTKSFAEKNFKPLPNTDFQKYQTKSYFSSQQDSFIPYIILMNPTNSIANEQGVTPSTGMLDASLSAYEAEFAALVSVDQPVAQSLSETKASLSQMLHLVASLPFKEHFESLRELQAIQLSLQAQVATFDALHALQAVCRSDAPASERRLAATKILSLSFPPVIPAPRERSTPSGTPTPPSRPPTPQSPKPETKTRSEPPSAPARAPTPTPNQPPAAAKSPQASRHVSVQAETSRASSVRGQTPAHRDSNAGYSPHLHRDEIAMIESVAKLLAANADRPSPFDLESPLLANAGHSLSTPAIANGNRPFTPRSPPLEPAAMHHPL